ncbi:hypothetical protein IPZ58_25245 [Streptomyces roseoverticillatus]|nr:hypothetical protein [Streptomyces roseoverticillatus]
MQLLDVREGHRVMDAGAGTGYNLAWLSHRLGSRPHRADSATMVT